MFGERAWRPQSPKTHPRRPINAYGETKLAIETALPHYERAYGLTSIALRYFNAAGADPEGELGEDHDPEIARHSPRHRRGLRPGDVPGLRRGLPDTPDGTCLRDYIHVTDLASAHMLALDALRDGRQRPRSTTWATAGRRRSGTSCQSIERVTGRRVPYTVGPAP